MKRTFTVNLNNTVFNIDDDAYEVLKKYLHDVEERLSLEERKEVMADIESRIAELFNERLQKGKTVVTMEDVEAVINIMGNPNQFEDGGFDESAKSSGSDKNKCKRPRRKLYRDGENAILGGVAAGLAAYLGWDVVSCQDNFNFTSFLWVGHAYPDLFGYVVDSARSQNHFPETGNAGRRCDH